MECENKTVAITWCKCENLRQTEDKIPRMKVSLLDDKDNVITKGYLSAFIDKRGRRFQITADLEGNEVIGGTVLIDPYDILMNVERPYAASRCYMQFAESSIYEFISYTIAFGNGKISASRLDFFGAPYGSSDQNNPEIEHMTAQNRFTLARFIDNCIKYAISDVIKLYALDDYAAEKLKDVQNVYILNPEYELSCEI